ncbi:DUF1542 domain-containing protein [Allofustis seminis]|uniref:DUF1542 domain-containing protein n=1 Tax=Allofustis seminis TaxID=166939 RepID=UPI00035EA25A|nr:DUF1542 domain-containing protein [Allofustis seminis]
MVFRNNRAKYLSQSPSNFAEFTDLQFESTSLTGVMDPEHPTQPLLKNDSLLNNYDINYTRVKYYTVTFDANGHGTAPQAQRVEENMKASAPGAQNVTSWRLAGWYQERECTIPYDFDQAVTGDLTLYAKWVSAAKDAAIQAIDQAAKDAKAAIDPADPYKAEKEQAIDKIVQEGKKAVDDATSIPAVNTAKDDAITKINGASAAVDKKHLDAAKDAAKKAIDDAVKDAKAAIKGNDKYKVEKEHAIDKIAQEGKQAVEDAPTEPKVTDAKNDAIAKINGAADAVDQKHLDAAKDDAKAAIDDAATNAKAAIDPSDPFKGEKEQAIDKIVQDGKKAVDDATTEPDVADAKNKAITEIGEAADKVQDAHDQAEQLKQAKDAAKQAIDDAATNAKAAIDPSDPFKGEKEQAIDKIVQEGKQAVEDATSIPAVNDAKDDAIAKINGVGAAVDKKYLDAAKDDAKKAIDNAATDAKNALDSSDPNKAEKEQAIDDAADKGKKAVDDATDIPAVDDAKGDAITKINSIGAVTDKDKGKKVDDTSKDDMTTGKVMKDKLPKTGATLQPNGLFAMIGIALTGLGHLIFSKKKES